MKVNRYGKEMMPGIYEHILEGSETTRDKRAPKEEKKKRGIGRHWTEGDAGSPWAPKAWRKVVTTMLPA